MKKDPISLRQEATDRVLSHDYSKGPLFILAGPGTGKTFSLIETVRNQAKNGINLSEFYVTTFTNAAAGDFESKIHKENSCKHFNNISTLHYRAKGIVHKFAGKIGLSKSFGILSEQEVKVILKDIRESLSLQEEKIKINEVKKMLERYREATSENNNSDPTNFSRYYWEFKKIYNVIDWFDVVYYACKILKKNKEICEEEASKQSFILVDEYQDLNSADQDLIHLLYRNHSRILVVGDDDQSIYSSRYANPSGIVNFKKLYPQSKKIILPVCSRCPTAVLKAAYSLINRNDKQNREAKSELIALPETDKRANGGLVVSVKLKSAKAEAEFVGKTIECIIDLDETLAYETMVLCANKKLGIELMNSFNRNYPNIPIQDKLSKEDEDTAQDLIIKYLSRFLYNNRDNLALRMIFALLINMSSAKFLIISKKAKKNHTALWKTLQLEVVLNQFKNQRKKLEKFIRCVKVSEEKSLNDKLSVFAQEYPDLNEPIQKWIEKHNKSKTETKNEESRKIPPISVTGVQFMTMHNAKGLDAKFVFVPFLEKEIKLPSKDIEEQRRLLYVAITRAKVSVIMSWAWSRKSATRYKAGGGDFMRRNRSNFIKECGIMNDVPADNVLEVVRQLARLNNDTK
ncbi:ATP-dependent helicase [candidate division WOR-3 bacterium]|nr:ATP-dependent helicase [candidate division WOR-3 bacterium]